MHARPYRTSYATRTKLARMQETTLSALIAEQDDLLLPYYARSGWGNRRSYRSRDKYPHDAELHRDALDELAQRRALPRPVCSGEHALISACDAGLLDGLTVRVPLGDSRNVLIHGDARRLFALVTALAEQDVAHVWTCDQLLGTYLVITLDPPQLDV